MKMVMDMIQVSASIVIRVFFPSMSPRMSPYWSATSRQPSVIVMGYPRLISCFPLALWPLLKSLPISAGLVSIILIFETEGSFFAFRLLKDSRSMSASPAKLRSAMSFQTMTVSEIPFREMEFRMLISFFARKSAAWALDPGTSSRYIVTWVRVR